MSDSTAATETTTSAVAKPQGNPLGNLISRMSLTQLTLAVLVIVFVWQWVSAQGELNQVQQEVARRLAEVEGNNKANQALVTQNQELVRELGGKLSVLESKFGETQNQRAALENLYQAMSSSHDQTALADVEQMLLIAGQQLQLSANVKASLIALQHAEDRLQRLNQAGFGDLKTRIRQDIERLRALPDIDVPAINQQIDQLIVNTDTLPLAQDVHSHSTDATASADAAPSGNAWQRFWRELWQEVRSLVRIENTQLDEIPLLAPTQTFFLRENLKLRLLSARLALLSHDEISFKRELKASQQWLKRYFDNSASATIQSNNSLQKLSVLHIAQEMPDISASLALARKHGARFDKAAQ
jgi:uroporphyrin-3 C-methyltransferase